MKMRPFVGLAVMSMCMASGTSHAAPLINMNDGQPAPGVITEWSGSGKKVTLTIGSDADPSTVASAIEEQVDRVRTKVMSGKVLVIGKTQEDLLPLLADIDLSADDDLDILAAAALDEGLDSGSSLRAKKTADLKKLFKDTKTTASGQVVSVQTGAFPQVVVKVRILKGPTGTLGKAVRKGKVIAFRPVFKKKKKKGGKIDFTNPDNQLNLGAYFLKKKDRVRVKIGRNVKGGYEAVALTR